jgi:hypothetical protein
MEEQMLNQIKEWMLATTWGVPHWAAIVTVLMAVVERFLGRSKNPQARSIVAALAFGTQWVLRVTRISAIPILGTTVVKVLEVISGSDIDGDGKVGDTPKEKTPAPTA